MDFIFALRLVVHIHALWKNIFEDSKAMDPKLLAIILFHYNFFKRELFFFFKGYLLLFTKFLSFFSKTQTRLG